MPHPCRHLSQAGCGSGQPGLLVGDPAHSGGWNCMSIGVPFDPGHSRIVWWLSNGWVCGEREGPA